MAREPTSSEIQCVEARRKRSTVSRFHEQVYAGLLVVNVLREEKVPYSFQFQKLTRPVAYRGGWVGGSNPPEVPMALQNLAKLNPIAKTVNNC